VNGANYFSDSTRYGADAAFENRHLVLKAEYIGQHPRNIRGPDDWGWYGLGGVSLGRGVQAVGKYEEFGRPGINRAAKNRAWTAGLNVYPRGKTLRLTFDYVARTIGNPGVRKGRLLAQVHAKF
jgi:hypothetical protein